MGMWIVIGLVAALMLSLFTGVAVAAVLGIIGRSVSELLDFEPWASAPLTRDEDSAARSAQVSVTARGPGST